MMEKSITSWTPDPTLSHRPIAVLSSNCVQIAQYFFIVKREKMSCCILNLGQHNWCLGLHKAGLASS